jgi:hypothetical protein
LKKFAMGLIVGVSLTLGSTVFADQIKQYILTAASYPIYVNGAEFKDASTPILNYDGSTYVPLAKLGDITGVNYKWNDAAKRVEIVTAGTATIPTGDVTTIVSDKGQLRDGAAILAEKAAIDKLNDGKNPPSGSSKFVEDHGYLVFHAYDNVANFMGRFTDEEDFALVEFDMERESVGSMPSETTPPPRLSEGWISQGLVEHIFKYLVTYDSVDLTIHKPVTETTGILLSTLTPPAGWKDKTTGDTTVNGIRLKKYKTSTYFNIEDLKKAGVIK